MARANASSKEPREPSKTKAYVEILRPVNCTFGALTVLIGILNAMDPAAVFSTVNGWLAVIGGLVVYFFVAGAGNVINDYFDAAIDKINRPNRPIPRGDIEKERAIRYFINLGAIATTLAVIVAIMTPNWLLIPASTVFFIFIGYAYARWGKPSGFPGNLMVGVSFSFGIPFGAFYVVGLPSIPPAIWFFFATSACLLISRELVKGMEDMEGDRKFNIKTVANTRGTKAAAIVSIVFSAGAIVAFTLPAFYLLSSIAFDILMILGNIAVVISICLLLRGRDAKKNQKFSSLMLKAGAFIGLVAYVLASL
nr:geranylgeranylglycerol-phosphate geranylgeranyltransferase [Candidatus Sigynarchaeota archaeon]